MKLASLLRKRLGLQTSYRDLFGSKFREPVFELPDSGQQSPTDFLAIDLIVLICGEQLFLGQNSPHQARDEQTR